jgi:hypothetical protein
MKIIWRFSLSIIAFSVLAAYSYVHSQETEQTTYRWTTQLTRRNGDKITKGMLIDTNAKSSDPTKPAFMAPPPGSKAYHGFPFIPGVVIDGFRLGTITDYKQKDSADGCTIGDAFVEAPDGSRAGLVWEVGKERWFYTIIEPNSDRWGVYHFYVPRAVTSAKDFVANFKEILPKLKELYKTSKKRGTH